MRPGELPRAQGERLRVLADRRATRVQIGAAPVVGDALPEYRALGTSERGAQCRSVGDQAVQTPVGGAHHDRDHLPVGSTEPVGGLVQRAEVAEPGAQSLRAERVDAEHVRHEADLLPRLLEQPPQAVGQRLLGGNREPGAGALGAHFFLVLVLDGV